MNNKLEKILIFLQKIFFVVFPIQTSWIISETFLLEYKWQWGTQLVYVTEFLIFTIGVIWLFWFFKNEIKINFKKLKLPLLLFFGFFISQYLFVENKALFFQYCFWILEVILLFFTYYLGPKPFKYYFKYALIGAFFIAVLAIYQLAEQMIFKSTILGLSQKQSWEGGVAVIEAGNFGRWLRIYGPFSHPNLLGGYGFLIYFLALFNKNNFFKIIGIFLGIFLLFLSFSKSAWIAFIILCVFVFLKKNKYKNTNKFLFFSIFWVLLLFILFMPLVLARFQNIPIEAKSVYERVDGISLGLSIIKNNLIFGVGIGQYTQFLQKIVINQPGFAYQPIHNTFLLILAEWGIVGIFLIFLFLQKLKNKLLFWYIPLLPIFIFDHYLYTNFIGLLFLCIYTLVIFSREKESSTSNAQLYTHFKQNK